MCINLNNNNLFCFAGTHVLVKVIEDEATVIVLVGRIIAVSTSG